MAPHLACGPSDDLLLFAEGSFFFNVLFIRKYYFWF